MKKTFKKIIALAIVLCTIGAMMIPGVSVTAAVGDTTTYSLYSNAHTSLNFGTSSSSAGETCYWMHNSSYHNWTVMTNAYEAGTLNWKVEAHSITQARLRTSYTTIQTSKSYDTSLRFFAYRIKSPGAGTYSVNIRHRAQPDGPNSITVYMFDAPAEAFTSYSTSSNTGTLHPYMTEYVKTNDALLSFSANATANTVKTETGSKTTTVGGGDLIVVFGMQNIDGVDDATNNPSFNPLDIYLVEQEASVEPVDYTLTYHANYEGASPATVGDDQNVTGVTEISKEFTVDAVPFVRSGYTFAGWATAADGDVVYEAGDTITLTSDANTDDLYAVWTKNWDPADNADLTVDFNADFTTAGVAANAYLVVSATSADKLDAAYAAGTIKWTPVRTTQTGTVGYNATSNGGRYRGGYLEVQHGSQQASYPYAGVPLKFKAPGTGEYKLSFTYGKAYAGDNGGTLIGAYIQEMPEAGTLTRYTNFSPSGSLVSAVVENPGTSGTGTSTGTVMLEGGKEYIIAFFAYDANGTKAVANFSSFTLTEVKPEASVNGTDYETVEKALAAAAAGDIITLKANADVTELDLNGAILDLNGKTLTTGAINGTVKDSIDGTGLIKVGQNAAVITAVDGQIVLWDNTTDNEGYRVFTYTFNSLNVVGGEDNVTGVDTMIDFYDYERNFLATSFDEDGEVAKGAGDYKFKDVAAQIKADYDAGNTDWRLEYCSQTYQMGRGGVCFSWGNKSIRHFGVGYTAVRFMAPADGKVAVTLKTSSTGNEAKDAGFDLYLLKASDVEALYEGDYEALVDTFVADPAAGVADLNTAITAAYGVATPVLTGVCDGNAYTGDFTFEENAEYIAVFLNNGKGDTMNFQTISFKREAKQGEVQTFWSYLEFTNQNAYSLVATSGLKTGFEMSTDGTNFKTFELDDATVVAWANAEIGDTETPYGFYIRVSGFEALTEDTTVTCVPYIAVGETIVKEANAVEYVHNVPVEE